MQNNMYNQAEQILKKRQKRKAWQKLVSALGCVVVFCTVYALILPALTMEGKTYCGQEEHTHTDACYTQGESYYKKEQVCDADDVAHTHTDICYDTQGNLVCTLEEKEVHVHTESCYEEIVVEATAEENEEVSEEMQEAATASVAEKRLICDKKELQEHVHNESCFETTEVVKEPVLICEKEVHTHTKSCYANSKADVETEEEWKKTFEDVTLTGDYAVDVLAIAKSQLGYTESTANYIIDSDGGTIQGYTRYGDWYGVTYGEWCAMYVSFCINYAEVEDMPLEAGCQNWINKLQNEEYELYVDLSKEENAEYIPEPGDLIFFNLDSAPDADHVGLVAEYVEATEDEPAMVKTIEGNSYYKVRYDEYEADTSTIMGYGKLPEQTFYCGQKGHAHTEDCYDDAEELICEMEEHIHTDECEVKTVLTEEEMENAKIAVIYKDNTYEILSEENTIIAVVGNIPDDAEVRAYPAIVDTALDVVCAYDIEIYLKDGTMFEPEEALQVSIRREDLIVENEEGALQVYYIPDKGEPEFVNTDITDEGVCFETDHFSTYAVTRSTVYASTFESDTPTTVTAASTSDFIDLNLYDYHSNINEKYNTDHKYPGFQWNGGAYLKKTYNRQIIDYIDFGNSLITDMRYGEYSSNNAQSKNAVLVGKLYDNAEVASAGKINLLWYNGSTDSAGIKSTTNRPVGISTGYQSLSNKLNAAGYPQLTDGTELNYLFESGMYADKKNTQSIDGLFQQDSVTGEYYYNSRWNHAQYSNNKFTLYDQIITPNFITYPFGNFLPFNDITQKSMVTQVSKITSLGNGGYVQGVINDLVYASDYSSNDTKRQLVDMLAMYREDLKKITSGSGTAWENWTARDAITDYLTGDTGDYPTKDSDLITDELLQKMYNIDWNTETNFFFGMDMTMNFIQPKGGMTGNDTDDDGIPDSPMKFYFTGDDDVWVYIDGVLFLDLTGIHRHVGGEIDFVNGKVYYYSLDTENGGDVSTTPYKTYTFAEILRAAGVSTDGLNDQGTFKDYSTHQFKFFYMERGSGSSVCRLNFNFPLLKQNSISVSKEVTADTAVLGNPDYKFQILKADASGNKTSELFVTAETSYTIYDDGDNEIGTGTTDANGVFTLKAGQRAEFTGIEENAGKYYVRELLDGTVLGQYGSVTVSGESTTISNNVTVGSDTFTGMDSPVKDMSDGATAFKFTNDVDENKLGTLNISKKMTEYPKTRDAKTFDIQVMLDGIQLPQGTTYTVGSETKSVTTEGIITIAADETATIKNILAGTEFSVMETSGSAEGYTVTYTDSGGYTIDIENQAATGVIKTSANVQLVVINAEKGTTLTIPGTKRLSNPDGNEHTYTFRLDEVTDLTGNTLKEDGISGYEATAKISDTSNDGAFSFNINYVEVELGTLPQTFYYKITENTAEDSLTNDTVYVVEVTVSETSEGIEALITGMWKNGEKITETDSYSADFVNTLAGDLVLSKTVVGSLTGEFTFEIKLDSNETKTYSAKKYAGTEDITGSDTDVEFQNGVAMISLKDGESLRLIDIPFDTGWTITETKADGYKATYVVTTNPQNGTTQDATNGTGSESSGTIVVGTTSVAYTNTQLYELPETGGIGTNAFIIGGIVFMSLAVILFYNNKKRGKGEMAAS